MNDSDQYSVIETIELAPKQKKEVCQKLKSYLEKAHADMIKNSKGGSKGESEDEGKAAVMSKGYVQVYDIGRAYTDMVKYNCFKDPPCIKALKAMGKAYDDVSKYYAKEITAKPHQITVAAGKKTSVDLKNVFADFIKLSETVRKAFADKEKYCK